MKRFGTFEGVFTPTILSIVGVVMYLRLGWVVGQMGLGRALMIICIANLITLFTGFSISSITTNIRIGSGGAYSIISRSLGLEVGGAIGIPLYLSQAISVAFYITGFTECWISIFPGHSFNFVFISLIVWVILLIISYMSARLAFRLQYIIMAFIGLSLVSAFAGKSIAANSLVLWEGLGEFSFWKVFAIFFPAVTGILAGVSMSGELKSPERSIPIGTLSAIGVSFLIYASVAVWFAYSAPAGDLVNNTSIIIELSRWKWLVIAGIMGATLSSALSMFVASPRTLFALGKHKLVPLSRSFNHVNKNGEPTSAILFTSLIALVVIALGTLDKIAVILTMFFLITYGMLNISVFIEKGIGIVSFRPTFEIPLVFSFLGAVGCFYAMFLINAAFSLIALSSIIGFYILFLRRQIKRDWPDVRKGLFIFIAEQAVKVALTLPYHPKIWKPNLLIPAEEPRDWTGIVEFIRAIVWPSGRVAFFKIMETNNESPAQFEALEKTNHELKLLGEPLKEEGILVASSVAECADFLSGATTVMQTEKNSFFPPNVLFLKLGFSSDKDEAVRELIKRAEANDLGILVFNLHPKTGLGQRQVINFWVRRGSPNVDLAVLIALQLEKNWDAKLRIIQAITDKNEQQEAMEYIVKLKKLMRLPKDSDVHIMVGHFEDSLSASPAADVNIFGMSQDPDIAWMKKVSFKINTSVLFLKDSKHESAIV